MRNYERILWWGNVRELSFMQRIAFAKDNRFDALNISPNDIESLLAGGETLASIRAMADDQGIALTYLDPVVGWYPNWEPIGPAAEMLPFLSAGLGRTFEFANALGIDRILAITPSAVGAHSVADLAPHLARLAQEARTHGVTVVLEAMPMWGFTRFSDVVALQEAVQADNVKLLFDTWHYCRGGRQDEILAAVPSGIIDHVQIADGTATCPTGMSLFEDCLQHRLPPGEGALPIDDILALLHRGGHLNSVGPEVFSSVFDTMTAAQIRDRLMPAFNAAVVHARQDT
ncbi:xylose isomerase-likeTIM barrel domain-containing protein [Octadecabacter antarcticus 307]|uniref:Xylose isomerase-likeTIM barrel domain-containing protein n=1 Tax=Octadecabacter antarcticus 307 TaxID=391626 RepID=M9R7M4_9RHOB|nr:sugar phosphate isomerase/epimerase family protein [Octadecabacter antarcticus]AGI68664.1 xylose isomerase-likeTIM barrel domain-containing protein [Octadecabacter antarcticus 307]